MKIAVIAAGGKGTRLQGVSDAVPKPLIPIGPYPVIHHQILLLKKYGIKKVIILLNHLPEKIQNYFQENPIHEMQLQFVIEDDPLGTAGGLSLLREELTEDFFFLYGDVMVNMDLGALARYHRKKQAVGTLVTHPNDHPYDSDLVAVSEDWQIQKLISKRDRDETIYYDNIVNAALYAFSPQFLELIERRKADLFHDIFPRALEKGWRLQAYQTFEYLKDMGTPGRLSLVRQQYESGIVSRLTRDQPQAAVFLDRDGTLNDTKKLVSSLEEFRLYSFSAPAVQKLNRSHFRCICVTNQPLIARNLCSLDELAEIHRKMATLLGRGGAYLDAVYFCPHHPVKGYPEERKEYKIPCDCRKPGLGMVEKAQKDFHLDLSRSWMVGDRTADIQMAKNAGMKSILVHTGNAGRDGKYQVKADFETATLADAVDLIVKKSS